MEKSFSDIVNDYEQAIFRADHDCWFEATIAVIDGVMKSCDPLGLRNVVRKIQRESTGIRG